MKYLVALPPVGHVGAEPLVAHHLPHLLDGGVGGHEVVVGQLVLLVNTWRETLRYGRTDGRTDGRSVLVPRCPTDVRRGPGQRPGPALTDRPALT